MEFKKRVGDVAKVGRNAPRNAPCPCGSGKKFKKCCLLRLRREVSLARDTHWELDEIRDLPTEQIVDKLRGFGVDFREEQFAEDVGRFHSASSLSDRWCEIYPVTARGFDEDFIWMAPMVLWERLHPEMMSSESIDETMQQGYDLQEEGKEREACDLWLVVWEHLKKRFTGETRSIEDAEQTFSGMEFLCNWCQDLEDLLWRVARRDPSYHEKNIAYCDEFCSLFPESDHHLLGGMRRSAADSYFGLGMPDKGERAFQALVEELPEYAWGYIGWGDIYCSNGLPSNVPPDYDKAERIYRMGLNRNAEEECIRERLEALEEERRGGSQAAQRC